jgi:hypothetical protein
VPLTAEHEDVCSFSDYGKGGPWNKNATIEMRMNDEWKRQCITVTKPGSNATESVRVVEMAKEEKNYQKDEF